MKCSTNLYVALCKNCYARVRTVSVSVVASNAQKCEENLQKMLKDRSSTSAPPQFAWLITFVCNFIIIESFFISFLDEGVNCVGTMSPGQQISLRSFHDGPQCEYVFYLNFVFDQLL